MLLNILITLIPAVAIYWFWLRPVLRQTDKFKNYYQEEGRFFSAVRSKFTGLKQRVTTIFIVISSVVVSVHDQIAPALTGVDVSSLTSAVPSWAWPLITIAIALILQYFRNLSEQREN